MHGTLPTLGCLLALACSVSGFVMPVPSQLVSGRTTRASTSQVIVMGRGDTRTTKGKRHRHSYGKCRPQGKKKAPEVYYEGELVVKPAPVARRWEPIEYEESELSPDEGSDSAEEGGVSSNFDQVAAITNLMDDVEEPAVEVEAEAEPAAAE